MDHCGAVWTYLFPGPAAPPVDVVESPFGPLRLHNILMKVFSSLRGRLMRLKRARFAAADPKLALPVPIIIQCIYGGGHKAD